MTPNVPYSVLTIATIVFGLEVLFTAGELVPGIWPESQYLRIVAIRDFGLWDHNQLFLTSDLVRLVSHAFIHLQLVDALFSAVFILAWGTFLKKITEDSVFLYIFFITTIMGGLGYTLFLNEEFPLLGASAGYFGLMGGCVSLVLLNWMRGGRFFFKNAWSVPIFFLSFSVGSQLLFGGPAYWVADYVGFFSGMIATPIVVFGFRESCKILTDIYTKLMK